VSFQTVVLKNGIRCIYQQINAPVSHVSLILNTGSRDEEPAEHGIAHFIEHTIFKGTKKRRAYHVLSRIEDVGGDLNAYTTKEETAIHATFLNAYLERAMELISDIMMHSTFPSKELEREKEVIIEEINACCDSPSDLIFDEFEELVFDGHSLGRNVLGTPESIKRLDKKAIISFIQNNYHTDQMVLSCVSNVSLKKFSQLVVKYFEIFSERIRRHKRKKFDAYIAREKVRYKDTVQAHCMLGNIAFDANHSKRLSMALLNNILAGTSMNSRLNMALREKNGIAYHIESVYTAYADTGIFQLYFGTEKTQLNRALSIVKKELKKLRTDKLGIAQMNKAKKQFMGQLTIASEHREEFMLAMGRSFLQYNKVDGLKKAYEKIEKINSTDLLEIANQILHPNSISTLIYK
jgi:predicted Zn-dependent peptidase